MAYDRSYNTIDLLPDVAVGIKLPMSTTDGHLFALSYTTEDQALSNLKNLILTRRGERLMEPLFGTRLHDLLFDQDSENFKNLIRDEIYRAVDFWLPYITITQFKVDSVTVDTGNLSDHGIQISMRVEIENGNSEIPVTFLITNSIIESM